MRRPHAGVSFIRVDSRVSVRATWKIVVEYRSQSRLPAANRRPVPSPPRVLSTSADYGLFRPGLRSGHLGTDDRCRKEGKAHALVLRSYDLLVNEDPQGRPGDRRPSSGRRDRGIRDRTSPGASEQVEKTRIHAASCPSPSRDDDVGPRCIEHDGCLALTQYTVATIPTTGITMSRNTGASEGMQPHGRRAPRGSHPWRDSVPARGTHRVR